MYPQEPVSSILQQYLNVDFNNSLQSSPNLEVDMVNSKILDRSPKPSKRGLSKNFSSKESSWAESLWSAKAWKHHSLQQQMTKCTSKHKSFILFSSHPGVLTPVRGESLKIMDLMSLYHWSSQMFKFENNGTLMTIWFLVNHQL